ncbi:hypothetical protein H5410_013892 [Solanum commersonii]|uniref:Uncharacterized protein n=1 Tax=Solanum commersonii TaxID=4109 RepID=A0A9J5ZPQ0_SOLCO|nr:hypothetical protein H5410_013892 [Solanum commersonii]
MVHEADVERLASSVLCKRNVPPRLKGKSYKEVFRLAMLYGAKCWSVKNSLARLEDESGSGQHCGQDEGDETEMVRKCEKEMDRCPEAVKKCERLAMTGMRRVEDMAHVQLIKDMTLDRRICED